MDAPTGLMGSPLLEQRYRLDQVLARGGMSTVYRGLDTRLDRPVAVKVMDPRWSADPAFVERFVLEARAAARLRHPNVIEVYDQGVDGEHVFLVMELVEGGTLRDLLLEYGGVLPTGPALDVLEPVLSALAAAHDAGLVHRDVKPENVLIGRDGVVKVADFGLVRAVAGARITSDTTILGTVAYLSPEQVATGASDARSDVYSAGILLYEMLTGAPPFIGDTPVSVAYRHVNDDVPPPSAAVPCVPEELDELVRQATRREPAERMADAAAFLGELRRVRAVLGLRLEPVPTPGREASTVAASPVDAGGAERPPAVGTRPMAVPAVLPSAGPLGPQGTRAMSRADLDVAPPARQGRPDPYARARNRSRRVVLVWTLVVLGLAGAIGTASWWLGNGRWTTVPTLAGLPQAAAERAVHDVGLTPHVTRAPDDTVAVDTVIRTNPARGARALRGTEIELVVSSGPPVVPQVAPGLSPAAAEQAIRSAGLQPRLDDAANDYDDRIPAGQVLRLNPAPGTRLTLGAAVTVVLSKGAAPRPVPDVTGMPHDQAFDALRRAGLQPYDEPAEFSDQVDGGSVIRTDPSPGTTLSGADSLRVGVVVSTAVTVPSVNGARVADAEQTLTQLGLKPRVQQLIRRPNSVVIAQYPGAGARVRPGSTVIIGAFP